MTKSTTPTHNPKQGVLEVKAPNPVPQRNNIHIFLAGSIDMGAAAKWHDVVVKGLKGFSSLTLLNPRRDDWDSSWTQTIENEQFFTQVNWEHEGLHKADIVVFNFEPESKAPITLLELGLMVKKAEANRTPFIIVRCPKKFWRFGNVEYICDHYDIPMVETLEEMIEEVTDVLLHDFDMEREVEK